MPPTYADLRVSVRAQDLAVEGFVELAEGDDLGVVVFRVLEGVVGLREAQVTLDHEGRAALEEGLGRRVQGRPGRELGFGPEGEGLEAVGGAIALTVF